MKFWLGIACSISMVCGAELAPARIQDAATKAVAAIQKSQKNWYAKQSCFSCHQQVLPSLAFQAAREHGIPVDEQAAHTDVVRTLGFYANLDRAVEYSNIIDPAMSDSYGMVAAHAAGLRPTLVTAVYARLLAARQEPDGRWESADERPPESYSPFTATTVSMMAIQKYAHPSQQADTQERIQRARAWLLSHTPHATEERVYQLLGACFSETDQSQEAMNRKLAGELKATQQSDGGWNSLDGRASDAYSTGQVLVALNEAGFPITDPAWQRGVDYLLRTQAQDGTWHVISRLHPPAPVSPPYFETGYPYGHDQFISSMGASWAVMALTLALPEKKVVEPEFKEAEPAPVEPWVETLLFGSSADVKKLLDSGFDPNSTSKAGGLTALMLATPDLDKMKLLLDHGANADARAKNRYSALLVASQYPGSAKAMELLLDHGAKTHLPKGQGTPLYNANTLVLSAFAGNAQILDRLRKEGDKVDDRMNLIGMFPVTPMMMLATTHRVEAANVILGAGADANEVDNEGISLLGWAAISNRVEMARALIQHGADVNHTDKKGMTPLLYAASIDFGDSAMIDLLLKSGAKADAKNNDGLTAKDLAQKYKHDHLLASLK